MTHKPKKSKRERQREALEAGVLRKFREINALSITFLRSASLLMIYLDERAKFAALGKDFLSEHHAAMRFIGANESSRMVAMHFAYYSSLQTVIEGWQKQSREFLLVDPELDTLLQSPHVETIRGFRNAAMHPSPLNDKGLVIFNESAKELGPWAMQLSNAFLRYFREFRDLIPYKEPPDPL